MKYAIITCVALMHLHAEPSAASSAVKIVSGSCSANIVDSVIKQPITITCGTNKEEDALLELMKPPISNQCVFRYPASWTVINDSMNQTASIVVPPGNLLSGYDFELNFSTFVANPWHKLFLLGDLLELTDENRKTLGGDDSEISKLIKARDAKPGHVIQNFDFYKAALPDEKFPDPILTVSPLRIRVLLEDGIDIESSVLDVFLVNERLNAEVWITPKIEAYPDFSEEIHPYTFRCEASPDMPSDTFAKICINLIEQSTMNSGFVPGPCYMEDDSGFKLQANEDEDG